MSDNNWRKNFVDSLVQALDEFVFEPLDRAGDVGIDATLEAGDAINQIVMAALNQARQNSELMSTGSAEAEIAGMVGRNRGDGDDEEDEDDSAMTVARRRADQLARRNRLEENLRQAREERIAAALEQQGALSQRAGISVELVDKNDRYFMRDQQGRLLQAVLDDNGMPVTDETGQPLTGRPINEADLPEDPNERRSMLMQMAARRQALLPEGFSQDYVPGARAREDVDLAQRFGGTVDGIARGMRRSGVATDDDGNVMTAGGIPVAGNDAILDPQRRSRRYSFMDATKPARQMNAEQIGMLQGELVRAGYLADDFMWGRWDTSSQNAYMGLLTYANVNGLDEDSALAEGAELFDDNIRFQLEEFRKEMAQEIPDVEFDQATLRESVRDTFRQMLGGREPSTSELAGLSRQLNDFYQQQVQAERESQMAMAERTIDPRAGIPDEFGGGGSMSQMLMAEQPAAPESVEQVDPQARFAEFFRDRYANEIDFNEDRETAQQSGNLFNQIGSSLLSRAGGGI